MYQKMVGNGQSGDTHREIERQNQQSKTDSCINFMAVSIEGVGGREVGKSNIGCLSITSQPPFGFRHDGYMGLFNVQGLILN